jgi:hypothetical protein
MHATLCRYEKYKERLSPCNTTSSNNKILRDNASMQVRGAIACRVPITTCLILQAAEAELLIGIVDENILTCK